MAVTTLEQLKNYAGGSEVELPGFIVGEPLIVKLRRPSLMEMAQSGKIPNPLLSAVSELFQTGTSRSIAKGEDFKDMGSVLIHVAKAALIEPSYADFEEAGLQLTDSQLLYIYQYVSSGVDLLKSFRDRAGDQPGSVSGKSTKKKPQPSDGD